MLDVASFEALYARDRDPWRFRTRWYEQRKRALLLASLPMSRYVRGWEPACANGELTAALAGRCDQVVASDASANACTIARERLAAEANVVVLRQALPDEGPEGEFDLIVFAEVGYYFDDDELDRCVRSLRARCAAGATIAACHWRRPARGHRRTGDAVHARMNAQLGLPHLACHREADFVLDIWCGDARSVARREGLA